METIFLMFLWTLLTLSAVLTFAIFARLYGVQFLTSAMVACIILANVVVSKFVDVFGVYLPAGFLIFSMTFLISDLLSEFWGKREAQKAVWAGFLGLILWTIVSQITIAWPSAPFSTEASESFSNLFSTTPRIVVASVIAYLIGQNFDVWFYHKIKSYTRDKMLWLRNNLSTITSQLIDSFVFFTLAFLGTAAFPDMSALLPIIITGWLVKSAIAILDTPFIYLFRSIISRIKPIQR